MVEGWKTRISNQEIKSKILNGKKIISQSRKFPNDRLGKKKKKIRSQVQNQYF